MCLVLFFRTSMLSRQLLTRDLGRCPGHGQVIASAEPIEVIGDAVLDSLQVFLVGGLGVQHQDPRVGA